MQTNPDVTEFMQKAVSGKGLYVYVCVCVCVCVYVCVVCSVCVYTYLFQECKYSRIVKTLL